MGAVDGAGVSEVDVGVGVAGGDEHVVAGVLVPHGQGAVVGDAGDGEQLAVDDPAQGGAVVVGVEGGVGAGDDGVPDTDGIAPGHAHGVGVVDQPGADAVGSDEVVEGVDVGVGGGDHQTATASSSVCQEGVCGVGEHLLPVPAGEPSTVGVEGQGVGVTVTKREGGFGLVGV